MGATDPSIVTGTEELEIETSEPEAAMHSQPTEEAVTASQQAAAKSQERNKKSRVALLFTGGTISMTSDKRSGVRPSLRGKDILQLIPELQSYLPEAELEVHDFATLPGPHMNPELMFGLAEFAAALGERMDGVVITHGTDSMEETAYFLDLVLGDSVSVVFTGAMHPATDAGWDGGKNLIDAIAVASDPQFQKLGALVVMNGTIHSAAEVTKYHTMNLDTFASLDFGPIGTVNTLECMKPSLLRIPKRSERMEISDEIELPYIELLTTYTGMDESLFLAALKCGAKGIVVQAMGQGNVPPGVINGISRARELDVPVVITSRCAYGPVRPFYAYEGAGQELKRMGCHFAPYLTGPKARIKLMLAVAANVSESKLEELFPLL